jgi:hypothetical protein
MSTHTIEMPSTTLEADELIPLAVARQVLNVVIGGSLPGHARDTIDPDAALDGVLMAVAMMLEQAPEFPTETALRKGADQFAERLAYHATAMRAVYQQSGVHPIDQLINRFGTGTN